MQSNTRIAAALAVALSLSIGAVHAAPDKAKPASSKSVKNAKKSGASEVITSVKPPSGQWEGKPPPAEGWVWSAGYYEWKDGRYQWKAGQWVLDKPGMDYRQHQWIEAGEGKWKLIGGDWVPEKNASS